MYKKLTLNIEEDLISFIHDFAKKSKQSVSNIFKQYISQLKEKNSWATLSKRTSALYWILKKSKIQNKKQLFKEYHEKRIDRS